LRKVYEHEQWILNLIHPTLNGEKKLEWYSNHSDKKLWWVCNTCREPKEAIIYNVTRGKINCVPCGNMIRAKTKVKDIIKRDGSLADNRPDLIPEWSSFNEKDMNKYTVKSDFKVFWVCLAGKGHPDYEQKIGNKTGNAHNGCPICKGSRLEGAVEFFLNKKKYKYTREYQLPKSTGRRSKQRLDFLVEFSGLTVAIECQGSQHYEPTNFGSTTKTKEEMFADIKQRDKRKRKTCETFNLSLIELPCDKRRGDVTVEEFLTREFFELGIEKGGI